jgi:hypothetical protein
MSQPEFERFRQEVLRDRALQRALQAPTDLASFRALLLKLGGERGYSFTLEDVDEELRAQQRAWIERWI